MKPVVARTFLTLVALFAVVGPSAPRAASLPPEIRPTGMVVGGPLGWQRMCARTPEWCAPAPARQSLVLNAVNRALLATVQGEINAAIRPIEEPPGRDEWLLAPAEGDCEDYALTKRMRLIEAGVPAGSLYFAVVLTERGEYHTVLFLDTTEGTWVLDNRLEDPVPWPRLRDRGGYRLLMAELPGSGEWRATDDGLALVLQRLLLGAGGDAVTASVTWTAR